MRHRVKEVREARFQTRRDQGLSQGYNLSRRFRASTRHRIFPRNGRYACATQGASGSRIGEGRSVPGALLAFTNAAP